MNTVRQPNKNAFCRTCCQHYEQRDMAGAMLCQNCYCVRRSVDMTEDAKLPVITHRIRSEKGRVSRYIASQVKKLRCSECGEKLFYGRDCFSRGLRLLQLNCRGDGQHSFYALIDMRGRITAVYRSGQWFQDNDRYVHEDIPF